MVVGVGVAASQGMLHAEQLSVELAEPVFTWPTLSWPAVFGIALPLFVVTMASQNIPGVAVIRASGYDTPVSPVIGWIGSRATLPYLDGGYSAWVRAGSSVASALVHQSFTVIPTS